MWCYRTDLCPPPSNQSSSIFVCFSRRASESNVSDNRTNPVYSGLSQRSQDIGSPRLSTRQAARVQRRGRAGRAGAENGSFTEEAGLGCTLKDDSIWKDRGKGQRGEQFRKGMVTCSGSQKTGPIWGGAEPGEQRRLQNRIETRA